VHTPRQARSASYQRRPRQSIGRAKIEVGFHWR
jgi:hypothetical protein